MDRRAADPPGSPRTRRIGWPAHPLRSPPGGSAGPVIATPGTSSTALVAARAAGLIGDQLLLLEHEPVLTLGRHWTRATSRVGPAELAARRIELIRTERGGEVTYHGPGQLTAYVIVRLADRGLFIRSFVRALEAALSETCAAFGVEAGPKEGFPGCWCGGRHPQDRRRRRSGRARRDATTASPSTSPSASPTST